MTEREFIYLASPYSSPSRDLVNERFYAAQRATVHLLTSRVWVYSPIVHCHELARQFDLPTDFAFWQQYNRAMIRGASELLVLAIDGWRESIGVRGEMKYAKEINKRVNFLVPIAFEDRWDYTIQPESLVE